MQRQAGFTLIEMVIVIILLAILATYAIPRLSTTEDAARRGAFWGAVGALGSAVSVAKAVNRTSSPTVAQVIAEFDGGGDFTAAAGACPAEDATNDQLTITAGTALNITADFNSTVTYCVSLGYAAGSLTKPTDL